MGVHEKIFGTRSSEFAPRISKVRVPRFEFRVPLFDIRYLILATVLSFSALQAQSPINWDLLQGNVEMVESFDLASRQRVRRPRFEKALRKLDGKEVTLKGYMLPTDIDGDSYVLSANAYAACFFCGGAGVESVIGLWFDGKPPRRYKTDEVVTFRGRLVLNQTYDGFIYLLQGVKEVR